MRIAFGTDEQTPLTDAMRAHLKQAGHQVMKVAKGEEWPEVGRAVGEAVAGGTCEIGVVCCYTGTGVAMAANKVKGVRAALCTDASDRRWGQALERFERARPRPAPVLGGCRRRDARCVHLDLCGRDRARGHRARGVALKH